MTKNNERYTSVCVGTYLKSDASLVSSGGRLSCIHGEDDVIMVAENGVVVKNELKELCRQAQKSPETNRVVDETPRDERRAVEI